jgi:VWFA-related protein
VSGSLPGFERRAPRGAPSALLIGQTVGGPHATAAPASTHFLSFLVTPREGCHKTDCGFYAIFPLRSSTIWLTLASNGNDDMNLNGLRRIVKPPHNKLIKIFLGATLISLAPIFPVTHLAQAPASEEKQYRLIVPVNEIVVPVTVVDGDGRPIYNLKKEDFSLMEDGIPQMIRRFSIDPVPLSVAILVDQSTDVLSQTMIKKNIIPLIESLSQFDEACVFEFESTPNLIQEFTSDKDFLVKAFNRLHLAEDSPSFDAGGQTPFSNQPMINGVPIGTPTTRTQAPKTTNTHIDDAIFAATRLLRVRAKDRRKIVLVISNGQNAPGNRHSYDGTMEALLTGDIIVYGIGQGTSTVSRRLGNRLGRYANDTGGEVFYPLKTDSFAESFQKISQMARNQYVLGYTPSSQPDKPGYRKITVELIDSQYKSLKLKSRKGYFVVPAS